MYELLFRCGKVSRYIFREKLPLPTSFTAGVQFCSSNIRYQSRPLEGYRVTFEGPAAKVEIFNHSNAVDHNKESDKDAEVFTEESVAGAMANVKEMAKGAKKSAKGAKESANMTLSNAAERFREFGQSMKKLNEKSDVHQASGKGRGRLMFAVDYNTESDKEAEVSTEESVAGAMANVKEMAKGAKESAEGAKESANMSYSNLVERFQEFAQLIKKSTEKPKEHQASGKGRGRMMTSYAVDYNKESDKEAEVSTEESVAGAMANVKEMAKGAKESAEGAKESANMSLSNVAERLQEFGQSMKKSTKKSNVHQASGKGHGRLMFAVDYNTESWRLHLPSVV